MKEETDVLREKIGELKNQIQVLKKQVISEDEISSCDEFDELQEKIYAFEKCLNALEEKAEKSIARQFKRLTQKITSGFSHGDLEITGSAQLFDSEGSPIVVSNRGIFVNNIGISNIDSIQLRSQRCPRYRLHTSNGETCSVCGGRGGITALELHNVKLLFVLEEPVRNI